MLQELIDTNDKLVKSMKSQEAVLGAWYFGSMAHDTTDEYSDIDVVFLIEGNAFLLIDEQLDSMLSKICDYIVLRWDESFNNDAIRNYCYLIKHKEKLFQYDLFLLNHEQIDDFMCRIHYTDLKCSDIIFDKYGDVQALIEKAVKGSYWTADISYLITTYWFHVQMSAKYFIRQDFFKLENILRILMDTHTSLLLSVYDRRAWGGSASKLSFIPTDKQEHLMLYGCNKDFSLIQKNLFQAMLWFVEDVNEIAEAITPTYNTNLAKVVMEDWQKQTI